MAGGASTFRGIVRTRAQGNGKLVIAAKCGDIVRREPREGAPLRHAFEAVFAGDAGFGIENAFLCEPALTASKAWHPRSRAASMDRSCCAGRIGTGTNEPIAERRARRPRYDDSQFSMRKPTTRRNSRSLLVTRVMPNDRAWEAISVSSGPMGMPASSSVTRTLP